MSGKPFSIASVLQEGLPKVHPKPGIKLSNRFNVFNRTDRSVSAASGRGESQKRARVESPDSLPDRNQAFTSMAGEEEKMKRARELVHTCKEGVKTMAERDMSGPLLGVLNAITEWMDLTTGNQETIANVVVDSYNKVASPPRKSRKDSPTRRGKQVEELDDAELEKNLRKKKFLQEVKEAERSSLIFKTNMGTVPVLNPDTMKRKFAEDLAAKAAAVEESDNGKPSPAVTAQLDDALEMVTRMEFFGKETKKAMKKGRTGEEEDFYSIPIKLTYKDKNTREAAESRLKTLCKVSSTVPYHRTLRNVINKVIEESKVKYPGHYIQVKVDAEKFQLRVSKMKAGVWVNNVDLVSLPDSVMDLSRIGPSKGPLNKSSGSVTDNMETAESGDTQG
jgi:predicted metal-dependent hydrolase